MSEINFLHIRKTQCCDISPKGGATFAWALNPTALVVAVARCSDDDLFNKATGRKMAAEAFNANKTIIFTVEELTKRVRDAIVPNIVTDFDFKVETKMLSRKFVHELLYEQKKAILSDARAKNFQLAP